jgi:hypothetical protein
MSRLLTVLVVIVAVLVAGFVVLGLRSGERPVTHVEKVVSLGDLQK